MSRVTKPSIPERIARLGAKKRSSNEKKGQNRFTVMSGLMISLSSSLVAMESQLQERAKESGSVMDTRWREICY